MRCRGSVYLMALVVAVVVAAIAVVLARSVTVHLHAAQAAVARAQCQAAAHGVVRAVVADLNASLAEGGTPAMTTVAPAGEVLGEVVVLLIGRDPARRAVTFGLIPEASRLSVNALANPQVPATLRTALAAGIAALPGSSPAIVACLRDWVDGNDTPDAEGGAERTDGAYLGAAVPYGPRNAPIEGLDELRLVKGVTDDLSFGGDTNSNGRLDPGETAGSDGTVAMGLIDVVGSESREPGVAPDGQVRVPLIAPQGRARLNPEVRDALAVWCGAARGATLWQALQHDLGGHVPGSRLEALAVLIDDATDDELTRLWTHLTGPEGRVGLVDAWSCPNQVLATVVGDAVAAAIIAARPAEPPTGPAWLLRALTREQLATVGQVLTSGSYRFTADVLAVRSDGAAWSRWEATIDATSGVAIMTGLRPADGRGWPLPWCTPERLRRRDPRQDALSLLTTPTE